MFDEEKFMQTFDKEGFCIIPDVFSEIFIQKIKKDLNFALEEEQEYHKSNEEHKDFGMVLLCSIYGDSFIEILSDEIFLRPFEVILGEGCIVYAYTSSSLPPKKGNYSTRIHVDCPRIIPNYLTNMGGIIVVDDFTEANGATWMLPASHACEEAPSKDFFYKNAQRMCAKAGSVIYFNPRTWHAGGLNLSHQWRHATTVNMIRPWMKQRIDIPRAMDAKKIVVSSERAKQKLGYRSQIPASYEEYYAPFEKRKFTQRVE